MSKAKNTQTKSIFKKAGRLLLLLLFVTGISLCATACQTGSAGKLITTTHSITEEFSEISVDCSECTIRLLPSEDGTVKIVCREREKYPHKISVSRGCLSIEEPSRVELFHILSLGQEHPAVTVYLPVDAVSDCALSLESASGDIELSGEFTFVSGEIDCASGDITCTSSITIYLDRKPGSQSGFLPFCA